MSLQATTWQTVGPYFRIGLERLFENDLAGEGVAGERIFVQGRVLDGDGLPIPDAVIELWQANSYGKYAHFEDTQDKPIEQSFVGYGRIPTDDEGFFNFTTVRPGPVPGPGGTEQAPHIEVGLMMRGLLRRLATRIYFPAESLNSSDVILGLVPVERRDTLLLKPTEKPGHYTWEIHMQGTKETVFFTF